MALTPLSNAEINPSLEKRLKILIVMNDEKPGRTTYKNLKCNQFQIVKTTSLDQDIIKQISDTHPDLIFLEGNLQGKQKGIEVKNLIQENFRIPVVYLVEHKIDELKISDPNTDLCGYLYESSGDDNTFILIDVVLYYYLLNQKLEEKEKFYYSLIKPISDLSMVIDSTGTILNLIPAPILSEFLSDDVSGKNILDIIHDEDVNEFRATLKNIEQNNEISVHFKFRARTISGSYRYLEGIATNQIENSFIKGITLNCIDLSNPIHQLNTYRGAESQFPWLADKLPVLVWMSDLTLNFKYINQSWIDLTGRTMDEELGHGWKYDLYPDDLEQFIYLVNLALENKQDFKTEIRFYRHDRDLRWMLVSGALRLDENLIPVGIIGTCIDISDYKKIEASLHYIASHDTLTGLYNRSFFEEEMARFEKSRLFPISIVVADIDGMKLANDAFGHNAGDELLRRSANVLLETFRSEDIIARIGGDEFAVLLPDTEADVALTAIARVRAALRNQVHQYPEFPLRLSMGAATTNKELSLSEALILADRNMYNDKLLKR
jgi:diguanylate cyclase (GGDEF)-like protein/PAS domain S-box-containing protein